MTAKQHPAASPWIPVTERMPEERVTVLLFNGHRVGSGVWNGRWYFDEDEYQHDDYVTHWAAITRPGDNSGSANPLMFPVVKKTREELAEMYPEPKRRRGKKR